MIKKTIPLSMILALRFFGLFVVLPLFSLYALQKDGVDEMLLGISIGGYALTQMLFQVPFGILSDKIGRKVTIIFGLIIFFIGSIICAISSDIYTLIFGRFLQGAGAIGAVITAMISDLVKEEARGKAMAMMGGSIAMSFALSMILGPIIGANYGIDKLFYLTAILTIVSIIVVLKVENPPKIHHDYEEKTKLSTLLKDKNLLTMDITNFLQKGIMTMTFVIIPIEMTKVYEWDKSELYMVYIPATILGVLAMGPSAIFTEKRGKAKETLIAGIILFAISFLLFGINSSSTIFISAIVLFFIGFNVHEPIMQSLTSKFAKVNQKGFALGLFNSFGYAGTFAGGIIGAMAVKYDLSIIAYIIVLLCIVWVVLISKMPNPALSKNIYIDMNSVKNIDNLKSQEGIIEYYINKDENTLIIKYNSKITNEDTIRSII
jgi:predicted MFS family arabinose efflux permease